MVVWDKSGGLHRNPSLYRFLVVPSLRAGFAKQSIGVSNRRSGLLRGESTRNDGIVAVICCADGSAIEGGLINILVVKKLPAHLRAVFLSEGKL